MSQTRSPSPQGRRILQRALREMESALALLDQADCPAEVAGHLDLAIERLKSLLNESADEGGAPSGTPDSAG